MDRLKFWKVVSVGNHFPLFHLDDLPVENRDEALVELAKSSCRHHFGVGGDGLLAVGMEGEKLRLRMFNPDGTEDFCGNGIRCAAMHARAMGWVGDAFSVLHLDEEVSITINGEEITSVLPPASYDPKVVPMTIHGELFNETVFAARDGDWPVILTGSALSTGSTHVVIPTGSLPDDEGFKSISSRIEVDPRFPNRTSVIWAAREEQALRIRIWERGVGETQGCGTGSSAAAVNWMRVRKSGGKIEVRNPGGTLWVQADRWDAPISLIGTARTVFEGEIEAKKMGPANETGP